MPAGVQRSSEAPLPAEGRRELRREELDRAPHRGQKRCLNSWRPRKERLKWRFIPNVLNTIAVNWRKLAPKSAFLTWALVCLIVAVLLLGG